MAGRTKKKTKRQLEQEAKVREKLELRAQHVSIGPPPPHRKALEASKKVRNLRSGTREVFNDIREALSP